MPKPRRVAVLGELTTNGTTNLTTTHAKLGQAELSRRLICSRIQKIRLDTQREELVGQWRQSMTAPDWCVRLSA